MKKNIYNLCLILLCGMLNSSCLDLVREDSTRVSMEDFLKNEDDLRLYVYSLYKPFGSSQGDVSVAGFYATLDGGYFALTENTTDILTSEKTNVTAPSIVCNTHDWDLVASANLVTPLYQKFLPRLTYISKARMAALRIMQTTVNNKEKYAAEAKAIIGWAGMILYDMFGPLPYPSDEQLLYWDEHPLEGEWIARPSSEDFLAYLEENLTEAIPFLPETQDTWGCLTKGAASMILLRVHLMQKDFVKAKAVAKSVYEMGKEGGGSTYELMKDYSKIFSIDIKETVS